MERIKEKFWAPEFNDTIRELDFIKREVLEIGTEKLTELVNTAVAYRENSYSPYSHYKVGAAILTDRGDIYGGSNSEFVSYSPTNHAEGTAISMANNEGEGNRNRKFLKAVAVVHDGDSGPCGECLQRMVEHADNCIVVVADTNGEVRKVTSLKALLPYNFNPSHLGI